MLFGSGAGVQTYPRFESDEFEDHLHSEEAGEEHVQDVHGVVEGARLAVVLLQTQTHTHT